MCAAVGAGWKDQAINAIVQGLPGGPGRGEPLVEDLPYLDADGRVVHPENAVRVKLPFGCQDVIDGCMGEKTGRFPKLSTPLADLKKPLDKNLLSAEGVRMLLAARPGVAKTYKSAHPTCDAPAHEVYARALMLVLNECAHSLPAQVTEEDKRERWWKAIDAIDRLETFRWLERIPWDALGGTLDVTQWGCLICKLHSIFSAEPTSGKRKDRGDDRRGDNRVDDATVSFIHSKLVAMGYLCRLRSTPSRWERPAREHGREHGRDGGRGGGPGGAGGQAGPSGGAREANHRS